MKLTDFISTKAIIADLTATDRDGAIAELVQSLADAGDVPRSKVDELIEAVLERERVATTGMGKGVAMPHAKHAAVKKVTATIGRSAEGIDFNALDQAPVYSVVLLLSPPDQPEQHLQAMETIFRHLQRDNFRRFMRQANAKGEIVDLVQEADSTLNSGS
ncbi:MAG: PTS system fructose-specific EIIABC component [Phycisphaerae bacterium]|nr:PTS system fructose-specific EIIABC component [Phycisphaerae bacterium]